MIIEKFSNIILREHWAWCSLDQIAELINGDRGKNYPSRRHYISDGVPFISAGNISCGKLNDLNYISEERYELLNSGKLEEGDIIYCIRGTLGKAAIFTKLEKGAISSSLVILRLSQKINRRYVFYYMQSPFGGHLIEHYDNGTAQPNLAAGSVAKYNIPLPPLPEQRAIVAKIEQLFSELDNGIANLRVAKEKLDLYREAVLEKAFAGELTKKWSDQNARIAFEPNGESQKTDGSDQHDADLQLKALPIGWNWTKLGQVTEVNPSLQGKSDIDPDLEVQFIPMKLVDEVINNIHLEETRLFAEVQKRSYTYFAEGDVLFAKVTPCMENGKIAVARNLKNGIGYGSSEFHVFRCSPRISSQYLFYFLVQQRFRQDAMHAMTGAVGLRRVPKKYLEDYAIALPPILEQMQIVQEIDSRLSVCDNIIASIEHGLEKAEALRQSILQKAFGGKLLTKEELDVCRKQPDWEPADKLLERIKKQRNEQV